MNALPLVSVVVPNYNYKRYLNLRIQSILQQTYQNIELILLDDASTDGSEEVLSDYPRPCQSEPYSIKRTQHRKSI